MPNKNDQDFLDRMIEQGLTGEEAEMVLDDEYGELERENQDMEGIE